MDTVDPHWSIGIYRGRTPFELSPALGNPIISASHISDHNAEFVADPFLCNQADRWHLFFETLPTGDTPRGVIGLAISDDGIDWTYQGTVLHEPWHLSYPFVFDWNGQIYMVPETLGANCVRLYRARSFPHSWEPVADLLQGQHADPSLFRYQDRWWMFTCPTTDTHDRLHLYTAADLFGPWQPHPLNPIIHDNPETARPAGRPLVWNDRVYRFAQDCGERYGLQVRLFEILDLSQNGYSEREHALSPLLSPTGHGWDGAKMHHVDLHQVANGEWIACVDGYRS